MQTKQPKTHGTVADARRGNWVDRFASEASKPYLRLARLDRPIGFWLLFWPCAFSIGLAAVARPNTAFNWVSIGLFLIGALVMRGAGCTFNDIVDRDIDDKIARTRLRPIPSGQVKIWQAALFMGLQALVGLVILLQFNSFTIWLGIASLGLVAIYPFMKRITWWPQLFLGLAFSWGALMGWASEFGALHKPAYILYAGSILWVIGYDTIYALQDIEDDALAGVKSTARLFGQHARSLIALFFAGALVLWGWAGWAASAGEIYFAVLLLPAALMGWQVITLDPAKPENCLIRFKANQYVGIAVLLALWVAWKA